jgi:hypothetical protein
MEALLSLCLVEHNAMKTYGGNGDAAICINLGTGGAQCSVLRSNRFTQSAVLMRGWVGFQSRSGHADKQESPALPGNRTPDNITI